MKKMTTEWTTQYGKKPHALEMRNRIERSIMKKSFGLGRAREILKAQMQNYGDDKRSLIDLKSMLSNLHLYFDFNKIFFENACELYER